MSWISRAIDWMADKVQDSTGEKERRNLVQIIKDLAEDFRTQVTKAVEKLNSQLSQFNQIIKNLNDFRSNMGAVNLTVRMNRKPKNCLPNFPRARWLKLRIM